MVSPDDELTRARADHDRGDLDRAEAGYDRVLAASPEHPDALHLRGVVAHQRGDAATAVRFITRACAVAPEVAVYARNLGLALAACGDVAGATVRLRRALDLEPGDPHTRLQLASLHHQAGDPAAALAHYREALMALPELAELHNQIGVCLLQLGQPRDAEAAFARCLALEPEHADACENRARALLRSRRFGAAADSLEALLRAHPRRDEAWRLLGFARQHEGRYQDACDAFMTPVRAHFAPGAAGGAAPADPHTVTRTKLRHDLEQLEALSQRHRLPPPALDALLPAYRQALAELPPDSPTRFFFDTPSAGGFGDLYNRLHLDWQAPAHDGGALNPDLDPDGLAATLARDGFAVADDFLVPDALAALRRFCTEPTIWFEKKFRHEVGASLRNGFCCPLLLQIAEELRRVFPDSFGRHLFSGCFAYKYYQDGGTGHIHADRGAVSMNMWITPDEANLDPQRGGLVVWNRRVPPEYFREQPEEIDRISDRLVKTPGTRTSVIPYRCNRAVLFPSDVLHATDVTRFAPGYAHRRISVTFLFGSPGD